MISISTEIKTYTTAHNGQVCYLRKALNDRFDIVKRRIKIADGNRYKREYIYTLGEQKTQILWVWCICDKIRDYADTGVDFIVLIPTGLIYNEYEMKALIDFYKLASKR